jgi:hypothetical protein
MAGMPLRSGIHWALEEEADALIREDLRRHTRHSENDILTLWKAQDRYRHEVYTASGVPDEAFRKGCYYRATNPSRPDLNSREGQDGRRRLPGYGPDDHDRESPGAPQPTRSRPDR